MSAARWRPAAALLLLLSFAAAATAAAAPKQLETGACRPLRMCTPEESPAANIRAWLTHANLLHSACQAEPCRCALTRLQSRVLRPRRRQRSPLRSALLPPLLLALRRPRLLHLVLRRCLPSGAVMTAMAMAAGAAAATTARTAAATTGTPMMAAMAATAGATAAATAAAMAARPVTPAATPAATLVVTPAAIPAATAVPTAVTAVIAVPTAATAVIAAAMAATAAARSRPCPRPLSPPHRKAPPLFRRLSPPSPLGLRSLRPLPRSPPARQRPLQPQRYPPGPRRHLLTPVCPPGPLRRPPAQRSPRGQQRRPSSRPSPPPRPRPRQPRCRKVGVVGDAAPLVFGGPASPWLQSQAAGRFCSRGRRSPHTLTDQCSSAVARCPPPLLQGATRWAPLARCRPRSRWLRAPWPTPPAPTPQQS